MVTEWVVVTRGTFLAHVASVAGCDLSILGEDGEWLWLVSRGDDPDTLVKGTEHELAAAKIVAEDAARRLAGDPGAT
jgi:hypothetical protein